MNISHEKSLHINSIKPIRNDDDLTAAFVRLEALYQAEAGSHAADERDVLLTLIEAYENEHYAINPPNAIDAIKFQMQQNNLTQMDLQPYIGSAGRVSEVLNGKRSLSKTMIKKLHEGLHIPYESLMSGV